jgi:hypothetical protein
MLLSRNSNEGEEGGEGGGASGVDPQMTFDERKMRGISVVIPSTR